MLSVFLTFPTGIQLVRLRRTFPICLPSPEHLSILPTFDPCIGCIRGWENIQVPLLQENPILGWKSRKGTTAVCP